MSYWREEDIYCLVDMVQANPFVWNKDLPIYKSEQQQNFWETTATTINNSCKPSIEFSADDCKNKFKDLRSRARNSTKCVDSENEMEYATDSSASDVGTNSLDIEPDCSIVKEEPCDPTEVSVPAYDTDYLIVKEEPCVQNEPIMPGTQIEQDTNLSADDGDPSCDSSHSLSIQKQPKPFDNAMLLNMVKQTKKLAEVVTKQMNREIENKSENYHYGVYVSRCMEKLDGDLYLEARESINSILAKIEKSQLLRNKSKP